MEIARCAKRLFVKTGMGHKRKALGEYGIFRFTAGNGHESITASVVAVA